MNNIEVIRSHLAQAVSDIDYFLSCEKKWESGKRELVEFYNSMEAKNAASDESLVERKLSDLTPEQAAALGWQTVGGETISDEQRNKVLADLASSQPMSDEEWENLQYNFRGGWRKSSDKAAEWLQKAGETVAADAIREELSQLPDAQMLASETDLTSYRDPIRKAAEKVRIILVACQKEQPAADASKNDSNPQSELPKKPKRSTASGEGEAKLIAALTNQHKYANGGCLNFDAVGNNALARSAKVANSTANHFFNKWFGSAKESKDGHSNYKRACNDKGNLIAALKVMNDELPRPGELLFGAKPPDSGHRGDRRRKPLGSELHRANDD